MKRTMTLALATLAAASLTLPVLAEAGKGGGSAAGNSGGTSMRMERSMRPETVPVMKRDYAGEELGTKTQDRIRTREQDVVPVPQGTPSEKALGPQPDLEAPHQASHGAVVPTDDSQTEVPTDDSQTDVPAADSQE
jgi:hypothetical protein